MASRRKRGSVAAVAEQMRDRLRGALTAAMKSGDRIAIGAYRGALSALDNAEAVPGDPAADATAAGRYASEAPRRELDPAEQRAIVLAEIIVCRRAADDHAGAGRPADALRLWAEADLLQELLG